MGTVMVPERDARRLIKPSKLRLSATEPMIRLQKRSVNSGKSKKKQAQHAEDFEDERELRIVNVASRDPQNRHPNASP